MPDPSDLDSNEALAVPLSTVPPAVPTAELETLGLPTEGVAPPGGTPSDSPDLSRTTPELHPQTHLPMSIRTQLGTDATRPLGLVGSDIVGRGVVN